VAALESPVAPKMGGMSVTFCTWGLWVMVACRGELSFGPIRAVDRLFPQPFAGFVWLVCSGLVWRLFSPRSHQFRRFRRAKALTRLSPLVPLQPCDVGMTT
jgi:hypothetical protein